MIIQENPEHASRMIRKAQQEREAANPRVEGLHVSDLTYCRIKSWFRKHHPELEEPLSDNVLTMFLTGHGHHALFEYGRPEFGVTLPTPAGTVHGTLDFLILGECTYPDSRGMECRHMPMCTPPIPVEIKTTRASSKKHVEKTGHYIEQLASYCLALGVNKGKIAILHIMGDYNRNRTPILKVWDIEFSDNELDEWRDEIEYRAAQLCDVDRPPRVADPTTHYTWECEYCPFYKRGCAGGPGHDDGFFVNLTPALDWPEISLTP